MQLRDIRTRMGLLAAELLGRSETDPSIVETIAGPVHDASAMWERLDEAKILSAKAFIRRFDDPRAAKGLPDVEFKVFSQFGDDGIIQYLIRRLDIAPDLRTFVEFGVEDYSEANTRFLLLNDNWRGLVMDGDARNIEAVKAREMYWRHDLVAACEWIDRDNINAILASHDFTGEIGLLSVDVDGNDYWVWEKLDIVDPVIVVVEYNSVFGSRRPFTVPYDPAFDRTKAHFSNLYWGASLAALDGLARRKGYTFVGCNSAGNNAYFVRNSHIGRGGIEGVAVADGYVESRFRESRDSQGQLTFLSGAARRDAIADMPVYDTDLDRIVPLGTGT